MATYLAHVKRRRQIILSAHLLPAGVDAVEPVLEVTASFLLRRLGHG